MAREPIHPKAMEQLNRYADETLREISFEENFRLNLSDAGWKAFLGQLGILQKKLPTFDVPTLYNLLVSSLYKVLSQSRDISKLKGNLVHVIDSGEQSQIASEIRDIFQALPIDYIVFLHLPAVELDSGFHDYLIPEVELLRMPESEVSKYGKSSFGQSLVDREFPAIEANQSYLKISSKGFASSVASCPVSLDIRKNIRELFTALHVYGFMEIPYPEHNRSSFGWRSV